MKFAVGNTYSPGRRAGSRNKLARVIFEDALCHWNEPLSPSDTRRKGPMALEVVFREDPVAYANFMRGLLPKEVEIAHSTLSELTDEELDAAILKLKSEIAQPVMIEAKPIKVVR